MKHYLAIDLGASSGRVMDAAFDGKTITLSEVHRFSNGVVRVYDGSDAGRLHWDYLRLFEEIKIGLRKAADKGIDVASIGIDTWGVDYALVGKSGRLVHQPTAYRDERTTAVFEQVRAKLSDERIYNETGIQFMGINTLYQLAAEAQDPDGTFDRAEHLLMVPDLLGYWLTGVVGNEHTFASTSQCYNAITKSWCTDMLAELGVPAGIFPSVRMPGDRQPLGTLTPQVTEETRLPASTRVSVVGSHDTASAVAAVPMADPTTAAYISSGTWSLVGLELDAPVRSAEARAANFTNEAGVCGTTRFLKNCAGLWLVQECRRVWAEQGKDYSFADLASMAAGSDALVSLFDPDNAEFTTPGDMPARIRRACKDKGEPVPADEASLIRAILDSLAMRYDQTLKTAAQLTGRSIQTLHIVGGGVANAVLNRITADATGLPIVAGPGEGTAIGNALVQALACGDIADLPAIRRVVADSTETKHYEPSTDPRKQEQYAAARQRFKKISS